MSTKINLNEVLASNRYFLHECTHADASFIALEEHELLNSSFLDHRIKVKPNASRFKVKIDPILCSDVWKNRQDFAPPAYIFHLSHVGSTLVAKALGQADTCLSLREPVPLRNLAALFREAGEPHSWVSTCRLQELLDYVVFHLARPFNYRTEVLVKCTSWVNEIAHLLLANQQSRALVLYCRLEDFVANLLKEGGGLIDLLGGAANRVRRLNNIQQAKTIYLSELSKGEIAAMTWLVEMLTLKIADADRLNPLMWLDFENYLKEPISATEDVAHQLHLTWTSADSKRLKSSGLLGNYSKSNDGRTYSAADRTKQIEEQKAKHTEEIEKASKWLAPWLEKYPELMEYA